VLSTFSVVEADPVLEPGGGYGFNDVAR